MRTAPHAVLGTLPLLICALVVGAGRGVADDSLATSLAIVHALDERPITGHVVALSAAGLELTPRGGGSTRSFPLDAVQEARFLGPDPQSGKRAHRATLMGGEVLVGRLTTATDDSFTMDVPGLGAVEIVYDVLRSLEMRDDGSDPCDDLADRFRAEASGDVAHIRGSGDRYLGTLVEANADRLVVENERGRKRSVAWTDLRVLHLENDPLPVPAGVRAEVELVSGTRIFCAAPPKLADGKLSFALRSLPDITVRAALGDVRALRFTGGRFQYASDLPFESSFEPYYPVPADMAIDGGAGRLRFWGARTDRRPSGCPLRIHGVTYRHGFAVHSKSVIKIPLDARFAKFESVFGIDDEVRRSGTTEAEEALVDARVVADGKVVWEQKGVTLSNSPLRVSVSVEGVKILELVVDFGEKSGPVGDDAAWANPILVKK